MQIFLSEPIDSVILFYGSPKNSERANAVILLSP